MIPEVICYKNNDKEENHLISMEQWEDPEGLSIK